MSGEIEHTAGKSQVSPVMDEKFETDKVQCIITIEGENNIEEVLKVLFERKLSKFDL